MSKIRVLVVDDAVVVRKLVTDVLASDASIEVVGAAANGRIALAKIPQVNPDVITLDVEMPEMGGLETLAAIRKQYPRLPVIMFSTMTRRGAATTLEALTLGANDYVTKPAQVGSVTEALQCLRDQLIPKLKLWCGRDALSPSPRIPASPSPPAPAPSMGVSSVGAPNLGVSQSSLGRSVDVVVIGVSTGGPNALSELLPQLPGGLPVPVAIVQHMPPVFTRLLASRLDAQADLTVTEAASGDVLEPGHAYLAPGDYHLFARRDGGVVRVYTNQETPENSCRPAADVLFRSIVAVYGAHTLGVILTGMGQDGLRGCEQIRAAGGQVLAQDEASSVVWGMPGSVVRAGLADAVLPLREMALEITRRVHRGRAATARISGDRR